MDIAAAVLLGLVCGAALYHHLVMWALRRTIERPHLRRKWVEEVREEYERRGGGQP